MNRISGRYMRGGDDESHFTNRNINTHGFWGFIDTIWVIVNRINTVIFLFLLIISLIVAILASGRNESFTVTAKEMFHIK